MFLGDARVTRVPLDTPLMRGVPFVTYGSTSLSITNFVPSIGRECTISPVDRYLIPCRWPLSCRRERHAAVLSEPAGRARPARLADVRLQRAAAQRRRLRGAAAEPQRIQGQSGRRLAAGTCGAEPCCPVGHNNMTLLWYSGLHLLLYRVRSDLILSYCSLTTNHLQMKSPALILPALSFP